MSAHDHGNCQLCDEAREEEAAQSREALAVMGANYDDAVAEGKAAVQRATDVARAEQREADARCLRVEFGAGPSFMDRIRRAIEFTCLCRPEEPVTTSCKGHRQVRTLIEAVVDEVLKERAAAIRSQR